MSLNEVTNKPVEKIDQKEKPPTDNRKNRDVLKSNLGRAKSRSFAELKKGVDERSKTVKTVGGVLGNSEDFLAMADAKIDEKDDKMKIDLDFDKLNKGMDGKGVKLTELFTPDFHELNVGGKAYTRGMKDGKLAYYSKDGEEVPMDSLKGKMSFDFSESQMLSLTRSEVEEMVRQEMVFEFRKAMIVEEAKQNLRSTQVPELMGGGGGGSSGYSRKMSFPKRSGGGMSKASSFEGLRPMPGSYRAFDRTSDVKPPTEMKNRIGRSLGSLKSSLQEKGVPADVAEKTWIYSKKLYDNMLRRQGTAYESMVPIESVNGHKWKIKNDCVGAAMKNAEGLPFAALRGPQGGKRFADGFYWGNNDPYLQSLMPDDKKIHESYLTPENADQEIGQHLAKGEAALIQFWNHVAWVYKDADDKIMLVHSGADVRPGQVTLSEGEEAPPGYEQVSGDVYRKLPGSKVNEVPLDYFLAKRMNSARGYSPAGGRNRVEIVAMSDLVQANMGKPYFETHYAAMEKEVKAPKKV